MVILILDINHDPILKNYPCTCPSLLQGEIKQTVGGGTSVQFTDVEVLHHSRPAKFRKPQASPNRKVKCLVFGLGVWSGVCVCTAAALLYCSSVGRVCGHGVWQVFVHGNSGLCIQEHLTPCALIRIVITIRFLYIFSSTDLLKQFCKSMQFKSKFS